MDGTRRASFVPPTAPTEPVVDVDGLCEPPADLSERAQAIWRQLAPHALRERTLAPSKAPGFARLCQRWVTCQEFDARIAVLGVTSAEADRLVKRLEKWEQLLDASLGNFGLRSFGKPLLAEKPKQAVNPFAALGGK